MSTQKITYELAVRLKDAGFPQKKVRFKGTEAVRDMIGADEPTLPELIEACGERFGCLIRLEDGSWQVYDSYEINYWPEDWGAHFLIGRSHTKHWECIGSTPEEAVAHLFLALSGGNIKER